MKLGQQFGYTRFALLNTAGQSALHLGTVVYSPVVHTPTFNGLA